MNVQELFCKADDEKLFFIFLKYFVHLDEYGIHRYPKEPDAILLVREMFLEKLKEIRLMKDLPNPEEKSAIFIREETEDLESLYDKHLTAVLVTKEQANIVLYETQEQEKSIGYEFLFSPLADILAVQVAKPSLEKYGVEVCAATILDVLTFFSFSEEGRMEKIEEIRDSLEKSEKDLEEGEYISHGDLMEKLHSNDTEEEKEYRRITEEYRDNVREYKHAKWLKAFHKDREDFIKEIRREFLVEE